MIWLFFYSSLYESNHKEKEWMYISFATFLCENSIPLKCSCQIKHETKAVKNNWFNYFSNMSLRLFYQFEHYVNKNTLSRRVNSTEDNLISKRYTIEKKRQDEIIIRVRSSEWNKENQTFLTVHMVWFVWTFLDIVCICINQLSLS